ncbi:class I SAM-dependent methyltransferase [Scytonema sp. PRP1]|uniref:class I SAM-dependent methyltransferase n=1 Tax=Scytonema sp. PRP1 TaxID=3120513 RepID=UPI00300CC86F
MAYLLQYFLAKGINVLGIEPAANVAKVAIKKGIPTVVKFFGKNTANELAADGTQADLLVANNVLAHVPDINDFVAGAKILLKPQGVITMEFPHLMRLMEGNQFDTIYHEHFSYLSLLTVEKLFAEHGLTIFDVEELSTHGGSLRIYARQAEDTSKPISQQVKELRARGRSCWI